MGNILEVDLKETILQTTRYKQSCPTKFSDLVELYIKIAISNPIYSYSFHQNQVRNTHCWNDLKCISDSDGLL